MMRAVLLTATMLVAATPATPAMAQSTVTPNAPVARAMDVSGSVDEQCVLGNAELTSDGGTLNVRNLIGQVVTIDTLTDEATLSTRSVHGAVSIPYHCNFPHRVSFRSDNNGLFLQSTAVASAKFANAVPYQIIVKSDDDALELKADALTRRIVEVSRYVDDARATSLIVDFRIEPGATNLATRAPLLAGTYRDTVQITVGPQ